MPGRFRPPHLRPERWPVRWRLAGVSALLTLVILLVFALIVGRLTKDRLENDFREGLELTATQLASSVSVNPVTGSPDIPRSVLDQIATGADATIALVNSEGVGPVAGAGALGGADLPLPRPGTVRIGQMEVVTRAVGAQQFSASPLAFEQLFVQYARDHDDLNATINRLWALLAIGVAGGTLFATLAGLTVANRAMRPIAALTDTARRIATTRDPSLSMPHPEADDEIAVLSRTLDSMLSELDAARTESQQMVQAQREFVADASHELRTPLTSILANLELLSVRLGPAGEEAEIVGSALRSSRRMRRLVGDLLMLARADAGRLGERSPQELGAIADAAIAEIRPVAHAHNLELDAPNATWVSANADELHRVVVNLLENGTRHTPPGSRIRVRIGNDSDAAILAVEDDGPGLDAAMNDQIFARFVRGGEPADVTADSGTGLGLAIVSAVAAAHGGSVSSGRSAELGGARFVVRLPLADAPQKDVNALSSGV